MAVQYYVEQSDRAYQSGVAAEKVYAGELVHDDAGSISAFAFADGDYSGLALYDPEFMAAEDEDAIADESVEAGDLVRYAPDEDAAVVHIRTPEDGGQAAPAIGHKNVVGVVDDGSADAPAEMVGRIVEEGYSNGSTTFDRATGNFIAIGEAYRPGQQNGDSVTEFDTTVRVELYGSGEV